MFLYCFVVFYLYVYILSCYCFCNKYVYFVLSHEDL